MKVAEDQKVAERPGLPAINFRIEDLVISDLQAKYGSITTIKDTAAYAFVMAGLREYRELRLTVDSRHKELKKDVLEYSRAVDAEKNRLKGLLAPGEDHLKAVRKAEDDRREAIKAEKERIEQERIAGIQAKITVINNMVTQLGSLTVEQLGTLWDTLNALEITEQEYQEFTTHTIQVRKDAFTAIATAFDERIKLDQEAAERDAREKRLAKIQAEQEAEAERLAKIKAEQEAKQKAEEEALAAERRKIEEDKAKLEAEKQAEKDRKEREERERKIAEEARAQAVKEAEEKAKQEEADRIAKEIRQKEAAKRQEALKPDKEKLEAFAEYLEAIEPPTMTDNRAKAILTDAVDGLEIVVKTLREEIERL